MWFPLIDQKRLGTNGSSITQFILGYKGYIQLAQRSGQYKALCSGNYDGQLIDWNPLTEKNLRLTTS